MMLEEYYPPEIVEWAQTLPPTDARTPYELAIGRLLNCEGVKALGCWLLKNLDSATSREEANQMITAFRDMIQDAAQCTQCPHT